MDDSGFILRTGETWKAHPTLAGVYLEQLSYFVFHPITATDHNVPDKFKDIVKKLVSAPESLRIESYDGFSLPTGRFKIISGDKPLLFTD